MLLPGCEFVIPDPNQVSIWGRVTRHGTPVSEGIVVFIRTESSHRHIGTGLLQPDGVYVLDSTHEDDGLPRGKYRILIQSRALLAARDEERESRGGQKPAWLKPSSPGEHEGSDRVEIPARYSHTETTTLELQVRQGPLRVDIELGD